MSGSPRSTALLAVGLLLALAGCSSLPPLEGRSESAAVGGSPGAPIPDGVAPALAAHPGLSGFHALADGLDAFAARIALIDAATRTLDVQYYIWHGDVTGRLAFDALRRAADRGVRVRLLLDDNNTGGLDPLLAALEAHPGIEVRLFNPFMQRRLRPLGFLTDFSRLNRRMHNKSLIADGAATILGGRNIGDEYFAAGDGVGFIDLDVLAIGPIVPQVAASFDAYWRSGSAYPVERLLPPASAAQREALARLGDEVRRSPEAETYLGRVRDTRVMRDLIERRLSLGWTSARLVVDDPSKGLGRADRGGLLLAGLAKALPEPARRELALVSPYFVPGKRGTEALAELARSGVKVKVLTNALESTDVAAVHSGYAKRRRALLEAGVELWELRRRAGTARTAPSDRADGAPRTVGGSRNAGSSDASLHAKTFAVDRQRIFIGSFNLDARSALYNTELGVVIDSPAWAGDLSDAFDERVPLAAYRVQLDGRGRLEWIEQREDGTAQRHPDEPGASFGRKLAVSVLGLLPIESLL